MSGMGSWGGCGFSCVDRDAGWAAWDLVGRGGSGLVAILGIDWQLGTDGVAWIGGLGGVGSAQLVCILWRRFGGVGRVGRHIGLAVWDQGWS